MSLFSFIGSALNSTAQKVRNRIELRFNNSMARATLYKYSYIHYEFYIESDVSYWEAISKEIYKAALTNSGQFFYNQFVIDHLASFDPPLGYALLNYVKSHSSGESLLNLCQTPPWGQPFLLKEYPTHSATTLSHISNICEIEKKIQCRIKDFSEILDFGGGFGGLARCLLLTNSSVRVTIQDSPLMLRVQKIFLGETLSDTSRVDYAASSLALNNRKFDLFNATFSLSETPPDIRDEAVNYARFNCRNIFIVFQNNFCQYQNKEYFSNLSNDLAANNWRASIEPYLPYCTRDDVSVLSATNLNY